MEVLNANLYHLMAVAKQGDEGHILASPKFGDGRYQQFSSGWYWQIQEKDNASNLVSSPSLAGQEFPKPIENVSSQDFQRVYKANDPKGNMLLVSEGQVLLGEGDDIYLFRVSGNVGFIEKDAARFQRSLLILLVIFVVGFLATSILSIHFGLLPLQKAINQLGNIRNGNANKIEGKFPSEISPLIDETNALINSNEAIVERARTQVGNLAHSLKTPLSVLTVEAEKGNSVPSKVVQNLATSMRDQIQVYLNRAMISARHGTITSRTKVADTITTMVRVFNKLHPQLDIIHHGETSVPLIFAGEAQDLEEILGNLLENAAKWTQNKIVISSAGDGNFVKQAVSDDGPGMSVEDIKIATKRGMRLDETKPGTGLGLSIVSDIVAEYGGKLELSRSNFGGLKVEIWLPRAQ